MFDANPPAERADAATVAALFGEVRAHHQRVELGGRELLASARAAGKALLKVKAACRRGEFLPALDRHWPGGRRTAQRYMLIAGNWPLVHAAPDMATALGWISRDAGEPEEPALAATTPKGQAVPFSHDSQPTNGQPVAATPSPIGTLGQTSPEVPDLALPAAGKEAELGRLKEVLRKLVSVQQRMSEVYSGPEGRRVMKAAEQFAGPDARFHDTQESYTVSRSGGVEIAIRKVCSNQLADQMRLVSSAIAMLKREIAEPKPKGAP